jgi:hypothetical protein
MSIENPTTPCPFSLLSGITWPESAYERSVSVLPFSELDHPFTYCWTACPPLFIIVAPLRRRFSMQIGQRGQFPV